MADFWNFYVYILCQYFIKGVRVVRNMVGPEFYFRSPYFVGFHDIKEVWLTSNRQCTIYGCCDKCSGRI